MNKHLIDVWNGCVRDGDIVVHLGDVAMGHPCDSELALRHLKGRKVLVCGNHDSKRHKRLYASLGWLLLDRLIVGDVLMQHHYLTHEHDFELVLHGHSHGSKELDRHIDVGVDAKHSVNYAPIVGEELLSRNQLHQLMLVMNMLVR